MISTVWPFAFFHMWLVQWRNVVPLLPTLHVFGEVWKSGPSGSNDKMLLQSLVTTLVAWGCNFGCLRLTSIFFEVFVIYSHLFHAFFWPIGLLELDGWMAGWLFGFVRIGRGGIWGNSLHSLWSARILRSWHGGCGRGSLFGRYFSDQYAVKVGSSDPLPEA